MKAATRMFRNGWLTLGVTCVAVLALLDARALRAISVHRAATAEISAMSAFQHRIRRIDVGRLPGTVQVSETESGCRPPGTEFVLLAVDGCERCSGTYEVWRRMVRKHVWQSTDCLTLVVGLDRSVLAVAEEARLVGAEVRVVEVLDYAEFGVALGYTSQPLTILQRDEEVRAVATGDPSVFFRAGELTPDREAALARELFLRGPADTHFLFPE